jgi:Tol biopolymer transport system component
MAGAGAVIVAALALAAGYALASRGEGTVSAAPPSRLAILSSTVGGTGVASQFRQIALTPDGDAVIFVGLNGENQNNLAYQPLDAAEPTILAGGMGMLSPQVTPDGRFVLGWSAGLASSEQERAARIPVRGGSLVDLGRSVAVEFGDWAPDGSFWFTHRNRQGISRLAPDGTVTPAPARRNGLTIQQIMRDGRTALVVHTPVGTASGPLLFVDLESGEERPLLDVATVEARVAAGYLLSVRPDGTMWAAPFDDSALRLTGTAVQIADQVSVTGTQIAQWAVAPNGTVAYIPEEPRSLVLVGRDGAVRAATSARRNFHSPRFSPDGGRVAVDFNSSDGRDVWILSMDQRTLTRATFTRDGHDATWTPDGRALTFTSFLDEGRLGIMRVRPGSGVAAESLQASAKLAYTGVWTPDGTELVTVASDLAPRSGIDLAVVEDAGRGAVRPLVVNPFDTQYPAVSPDGRWLAFVSNQSGAQQVYVRPLHGEGIEVQVSQDGGTEPVWGPDGGELFYVGTARAVTELMVASVRTSPAFEVTARTSLFDTGEIVGANPHANYDIAPDGRSFVMVQRNPANRIIVLQNVPELVRRLGPGAGS